MTARSEPLADPATFLAMDQAARAALNAPSVFNTQPWRWRLTRSALELYADETRRLSTVDPDGRLMLLSCGAALHHAVVSATAAGRATRVDLLPDHDRPALLARIRPGKEIPADPERIRMAAVIPRRRTDRRAYSDRPVGEEMLTRLRRFVEHQGAYLHVVPPDAIVTLAMTTRVAADIELADPAYRAELSHWTNRPAWIGDGIARATAVRPEPRRVPLRDFVPGGTAGLPAGRQHDRGAAYVVLFGVGDRPADLLRGGMALSALLLMATAEGLASAVLSDAVEVAWPRTMLRTLLSGIGEPYVAVRLGYAPSRDPVPATPRREAAEAVSADV